MNKNYFIVGFLVLLVVISSCKTDSNNVMKEKDSSILDKEAMSKDETMMEEKESSFMSKGTILAGSKTLLIDFNKEDYEKALAENKVVFLYFYANWCPICRTEEPILRESFNELDKTNVVGFRVNYKDSDTDSNEVELAKQFGITYQHTKIIIKNGERVLKDGNSWNKEMYINEINKYA